MKRRKEKKGRPEEFKFQNIKFQAQRQHEISAMEIESQCDFVGKGIIPIYL
jgi:hypothetical protein